MTSGNPVPVLARDLGAVRGRVDHLAGGVGSAHAASRERSPGRHGEVGAQWFVIRQGQARPLPPWRP